MRTQGYKVDLTKMMIGEGFKGDLRFSGDALQLLELLEGEDECLGNGEGE